MLLALTSFFFCAFSLVVTGPSIVEVEVPSAFVVVLAIGLKEFPYSMTSHRAQSSLNPNSVDLNKTDDEEETQKDEFVHTPDDYVTTNDETHDVDDKEYDRINKEMYDDVNVDLKDAELVDEGKGDKEMTDAEKLNAKLKEVNQEVTSAQVQAGPQATTTASPAQVASLSRSVSSNYGSIFLNLDNISSVDTEIISMLDVQVQHENPKAITSTTVILKSTTLSVIHQRVSDLEKEVKILGNVDHNSAVHAAIKFEVPIVVKEYLGTNLEDSFHKVIQKQTADFIHEHTIPVAVVTDVPKQQQ
ncbi:hypothetical protein Tco_0550483 [Tanacetum coccineum]